MSQNSSLKAIQIVSGPAKTEADETNPHTTDMSQELDFAKFKIG